MFVVLKNIFSPTSHFTLLVYDNFINGVGQLLKMKSIAVIILIFVLMQLIGLYIGNVYIGLIRSNVLPQPQAIPGVSSDSPEVSFLLFGYIIITTVIMLFVIRIKKSAVRGIEAFVVFVSSWVTFSFLIPFQFQDIWLGAAQSLGLFGLLMNIFTPDLLLAIGLTVWKVFRPTIISQDVAAIFSGSGVGAILGMSLGIAPSIIFMMILSVYDFVSVFITKHMITMAKAVTERPMAFTIAAPHKFKQSTYVPAKGAKKKVHVFQLGLGDIVIPLMFSVAILNSFSILNSLMAMAGSVVALIILTLIITRKPMALPALPFVCSGALAGYILSLLIL
jgi:presenilin-like A22 family membrane protease